MFFLLLILWIILNGKVTLEIVIFGAIISGGLVIFMQKFFGYKLSYDKVFIKKLPLILEYAYVLIIEIFKANYEVLKLSTSSEYEIEPALVTFKTDLKSNLARVCLANSITLTPGTITVELNEDEYTVHCLDKSLAIGLSESVFVKLLREIEA